MKYLRAFVFLSFFAMMTTCIMTADHESDLPAPTNAEQCVDPEYSNYSWVRYAAVEVLKRNLNDPDSYQKIGQHFAGTRVVTNYRAKNGFGGYVVAVSISEVTYVDGKCMVTLIQ